MPPTADASSPRLDDYLAFEKSVVALLANDRADEARKRINSAIHSTAGGSDPRSRVLALILSGELEVHENQPQAALAPLKEALGLAAKLELPPETRLRLLHVHAESLELCVKNDAAIDAWHQLASVAESCQHHGRQVLALNNEALLLQAADSFEEAESRLIQAIDIVQGKIGENDPLVPKLLEAIGTLYWKAGYPDASIQVYRDALEAIRSSPQSTHEDKVLLRGNLAAVLFENDQFKESRAEFEGILEEIQTIPHDGRQQFLPLLDNAITVFQFSDQADLARRAETLRTETKQD